MNKNYQMSELMKAAIVNSLLTVILVNVSIVFQDNHKEALEKRRIKRNEIERQKTMENMRRDIMKTGIVPGTKPDPNIYKKPPKSFIVK